MRTEIAAPADIVWRLTEDVEGWPELTPTMTEVRRSDDGPLRAGSQALVRQPGLRPAQWRVTAVEPGRSFVWQSTTAGVTSIAEHVVEPTDTGTRMTLRFALTGRLAWLIGALYGRRIRRYVATEAAGFRRAAESAAAS